MSPTAPMLAQSESKAMFFLRLGLDDGNKMHRQLYIMMKEEAASSWKRITSTRDALAAQYKYDSSVKAPYTFNQIDELAVQHEIVSIHRRARPQTRVLYDLGRDFCNGHEENWIIRWLLWHVFRYRDDRNSTSRRMARSTSSNGGSPGADTSSSRGASVEFGTPAEATPNASPTATYARTTVFASDRSRESSSEASSRFWDPVRGCYRT